MRILIATLAACVLTAAGSAGMALHAKPARRAPAPQGAHAIEAVPGITWQSGTATLRLTDRPCPFDDLSAQLAAEGIGPVRAYVVQQGNRQVTGCWSKDAGGDVATLEPGRQLGQIPVSWFRVAPR
jgi:hypothetical protein